MMGTIVEDDARVKLGERFDVENMTAETEFWDSIEVYPAGYCEFGRDECIHKSSKVCNSCEQKEPSNLEVE